ncbi:MAG TPA: hypothetical protein PKE47_15755, partial [Verrucomicrobiota bacterium]|nr:hypothetical protein [Verrucomicrobiota bacterium]
VMRALAKERELRQQSGIEVQTEVEGLATSEGRAPASPGGEAPGATGSLANAAIPLLPARASRLAGWAVIGMALPLAVLAVVGLAVVWSDSSWNPGREELLVALALWIGAPITLLSGLGLLRHGRPARVEISRGTVAVVEGLGFVAGLLCVGVLFASSPHPAGLLTLVVPPLAGLVLLVAAGGQRCLDGFTHRPVAARPTPASEYRSPRTLWGLPLLHIVRGTDPATGREREARGIVAIGGRATGVLAIGGVAGGGVAVGGVAFGLFAFGGLAFGGAAVGGLALGLFSLGGLAVGLALALGGIAVGWSAFGGLVVAQHGLGGFMAAGQRLPDTGLAGTLIRWLPWLWIPVLPLSLVPGVVSAWAYRKLEPPRGPRPNPWPHLLFWLVVGLIVLPLLAVVAGLVGARAPWLAALLMLGSGSALVMGWRLTRPTAATPPETWSPWPKRVFLAVLAVVVLPLGLIVLGLLLPRLATQTAGTVPPVPVAARDSLSLAGLPETLTEEQARHPANFLWHQAWRRWQQVTGRIAAGELAWDDPEVLADASPLVQVRRHPGELADFLLVPRGRPARRAGAGAFAEALRS